MSWEPKPEVVEVMARWLFRKEHPDVLDWEADERAAEPTKPPATAREPDVKSEYEERARQMLIVARMNSGSGG
ncbi:hypothetical protein [Hansschlegelia zhihuaiae]|uniref:Uncharacterized protein n=1 Tax=Hansschlegelia zhihuaiae TaxID=405005 RepID=A0A4V1KJC8_9HYPH|nr:hypothetical protein [Hansschlegelia zhihuaiae]RXF73742.1 hypothetical protein EK403_09150 [Hansschlegelia zhihuaiae]